MKLTIEKCNATDSLRDYINGLPERMTFDQVNDPKSELFSDLDSDEICDPVEASIQVPMYTKRKAIDLHLFLKQGEEEQQLLAVERERLLSYDFKGTAVDTNVQSEDEEDVEELSDIESDSE